MAQNSWKVSPVCASLLQASDEYLRASGNHTITFIFFTSFLCFKYVFFFFFTSIVNISGF